MSQSRAMGARPVWSVPVARTSIEARPRAVSEMPARAAAAVAAVMPGTTSNASPAVRTASISSARRPKIVGSPPFSLTAGPADDLALAQTGPPGRLADVDDLDARPRLLQELG